MPDAAGWGWHYCTHVLQHRYMMYVSARVYVYDMYTYEEVFAAVCKQEKIAAHCRFEDHPRDTLTYEG